MVCTLLAEQLTITCIGEWCWVVVEYMTNTHTHTHTQAHRRGMWTCRYYLCELWVTWNRTCMLLFMIQNMSAILQ